MLIDPAAVQRARAAIMGTLSQHGVAFQNIPPKAWDEAAEAAVRASAAQAWGDRVVFRGEPLHAAGTLKKVQL